jgi:CheY-like chemotaxis protein
MRYFVRTVTYSYSYIAFLFFLKTEAENKVKILIAEDEHIIANSYKLLLESRKHEVVICSNGEECLKLFDEHALNMKNHRVRGRTKVKNSSSHPFDLLILDYRMPKKNGLEVAEQILSRFPNQRILIASAYNHEILNSKGLNRNVQMLDKPFEFDLFVSVVEQNQIASPGFTLVNQARSVARAADLSDRYARDGDSMYPADISEFFRPWR